MKYELTVFLRKAVAWLLGIFMTVFSVCTPDEPIYSGKGANKTTAYDAQAADYALSINAGSAEHEISDLLYGVFFEDINFAADGGLYAEMVVNRSFEFGSQAKDDELYGWSAVGESEYEVIKDDEAGGLNVNNQNYLVIKNGGEQPAGVSNCGFLDGMAIEKGVEYDFSVYAKSLSTSACNVIVRLTANGETACQAQINGLTDEWQKYELTLTSELTASSGVSLEVLLCGGAAAFDMVSLFPPTYKDHGLRIDLAQKVAELEPSFIRFPGGCIIEGQSDEFDYDWKASVATGPDGMPLEFNSRYGDVAARPLGTNLWTDIEAEDDPLPCFMTYGLGFYEYFQFAEDIGAVGVPVLNCGLYCQMRGKGGVDMQSERFERYVQDMVDLVEFCRGGEDTTWGKVRVSMGHPEPFELKYIGIGNENEGEDYYERYEAFLYRFNEEKAKNPQLYEGVELIYSSGGFDATGSVLYLSAYENASDYITENGLGASDYAGLIDQHYYKDPEWFLKHTDYYDERNYKRDAGEMTDTVYGGAIPVFLGEYAARSNTLRAALAEAAYMTGLERNGDIVKMASYAPLFGNLTATHWSPNLIWFNNSTSTGSVNYYMQKLFSTNAGSELLYSELTGAEKPAETLGGMVGLGTWYTKAQFDDVRVVSNATGKTLASDAFTLQTFPWRWHKVGEGEWKTKNGVVTQTVSEHRFNELGATAYFGSDGWTDYTYTFNATKLEGAEGFYIPFCIRDENNLFYWNIGGWGNTRSGLQRVENGVKSGLIPGTGSDFTVQDGKTYSIRIEVGERIISGYIDGELQFSYDAVTNTDAEAYQVVSRGENGDIIIKLVNVTDSVKTFAVDISSAEGLSDTARIFQVAGDSLDNDNILAMPEDCVMLECEEQQVCEKFNFTVPRYSATVIRIGARG